MFFSENAAHHRVICLRLISIFCRFTRWHITPRGAAFSRVYGQPNARLCSLPVSVLLRAGTAGKTNQEVRDGNRTRLAGSNVAVQEASFRRPRFVYLRCIYSQQSSGLWIQRAGFDSRLCTLGRFFRTAHAEKYTHGQGTQPLMWLSAPPGKRSRPSV